MEKLIQKTPRRGADESPVGPDTSLAPHELRVLGVALDGQAPADLVNRTHRVIQQRARTMRARRTTLRTLSIPLTVCAGLFVAVLFAIWSVVDQYELTVDAIPDTSQQMMVLTVWCLPMSLIVLTVVWLRRGQGRGPVTGAGSAAPEEGAR